MQTLLASSVGFRKLLNGKPYETVYFNGKVSNCSSAKVSFAGHGKKVYWNYL